MKTKIDKPSADEFGKLRATLARMGMSQQQINESIGSNILTRGEIADKLVNWLKGNDVRISS